MLNLFSWIWKLINGEKKIPEEDFQNDIREIQKATEQILKDWIWMCKLISQMKEDQKAFVIRLQDMSEVKSKMLEQTVNTSLEKIFKRNDQSSQEMQLRIETIQEDIQAVKADVQSILHILFQHYSGELDRKTDSEENKSSSSAKKGCGIKKKTSSLRKNRGDVECDASKLIATVKESLTDIFQDAKLHLSLDREEENKELEIILTKLAEDRDDIKKTILEAFSIAAEQAKINYNQFGEIGEDTLKYIALLNDNTNKLLQAKFDETDDVLKNTLNAVNRQNHDIDAVRKTIGNMDGEFGALFEKLIQIHQINMKRYEEIGLSLERTSNSWVQNVSEKTKQIEKMTNQIFDDTEFVKQILGEVKDLAHSSQQIESGKNKEKAKGEIVQNSSDDKLTIQDQNIILDKQKNMTFVYSCWERMRSVSCNLEDGCHSICKLIFGLEQKLGSLNDAIEKLDEFIRGINLDILAERVSSMDCNGDTARIVNDIMQTGLGDAGDGHSQVTASRLRNTSLAHKLRNTMAVANAVKLTELILRKICDENNCQNNEISTQSNPNNLSIIDVESPLFTLAAPKEQKNEDIVVHESQSSPSE